MIMKITSGFIHGLYNDLIVTSNMKIWHSSIPLATWSTFLLLVACHSGPKVIEPTQIGDGDNGNDLFVPDPSTLVTPPPDGGMVAQALHKVAVKEVMPTDRYVYLRVSEGKHEFWIATRKQEVEKGAIYYYKGGLLKTHFESKEYQKVFDTIYLVSSLVPENHSKGMMLPSSGAPASMPPAVIKEDIPMHSEKPVTQKGVVTIAELVKDPKKFEGHTIQIHGTCVKINPNIMNRNWIHLQDGTKDSYDLVITSTSFVPEGEEVTMTGVVGLNKDFGAGYTYDIILENGLLIQ